LETLADTDDHVLDQGLDCSQASDVLAGTVPHDKLDLGRLLRLLDLNIHIDVTDVLRQRHYIRMWRDIRKLETYFDELPSGTLNGDCSRLDSHGNALGHEKLLVLVDILAFAPIRSSVPA
jgi:hypothetical protein